MRFAKIDILGIKGERVGRNSLWWISLIKILIKAFWWSFRTTEQQKRFNKIPEFTEFQSTNRWTTRIWTMFNSSSVRHCKIISVQQETSSEYWWCRTLLKRRKVPLAWSGWRDSGMVTVCLGKVEVKKSFWWNAVVIGLLFLNVIQF